jgi:hypothetical protein
VLSYRRTPRRQGLNTVGHGGRNAAAFLQPCDTVGTAADLYFSKFLVRPFIFRKSKKKILKKFLFY